MSAPPPPRPTRPGKKEISVVRAIYDYNAQNPDELSFTEGCILYVLDKSDGEWWRCKCDEKEGLVPSNYVGENTAEIENPLHEASKRGNISFAKELINAGVSVNSLDKAGNTPLHWAARGGHHEVILLLLTKKPALNSQNKLGDTPLHMATWGGHEKVVESLLKYPELEIGILNKDGKTPLQLSTSDKASSLLVQFGNSNCGMVESDED